MFVESAPGAGSTFSFRVPRANPCEVLQRYLNRLASKHNAQADVSLLSARINDSVSLEMAADMEAFLNYLLRRNDLLFNVEPRRWLIVLPATAEELKPFLARAEMTWKETNRNRPHGPLPEVQFQTEGAWRVLLESNQILARARELTGVAEAIHV
jgi:hypothetical protein